VSTVDGLYWRGEKYLPYTVIGSSNVITNRAGLSIGYGNGIFVITTTSANGNNFFRQHNPAASTNFFVGDPYDTSMNFVYDFSTYIRAT
jgi:hypothetical protein